MWESLVAKVESRGTWTQAADTLLSLAVFFLFALFWGGSKITADGNCSHEIKRHLLLGRKVMTNLDSILKSTDITLPTNVHLAKAMFFPVVMYRCESWTIKLSTKELMLLNCGVGLLRVPWTARRSNQSILKEISLGFLWKE